MSKTMIEIQREARDRMKRDLDAVLRPAEIHKRDLSPAEAARFGELRSQILAQDELIADTLEAEARSARVDAVRAETAPRRTEGWSVGAEARTYQPGTRSSWVADMASVALGRDGAADARGRLERNNAEFQVEHRALTTTDGAGGDFVPPVYLVDQFISLARAGRPTADRVMNQTLPGGTDTINVPRVITGTAVAEQVTQNTAVQNTDATTGTATAAVATLAGAQTISVQMLEQSPLGAGIDTMLLGDLMNDLAVKVDVFVLNNNATNKVGLLNVAAANPITYTDAAPTTAKIYQQIANAIQLIQTSRYLPPDTIAMHPRRWAMFLASQDSQGRPLVTPNANFNTIGTANGTTAVQGPVGSLQGVEVITDPSIPTNLGAGTNQDAILILRAVDSVLYESTVRAEAFRDTKADTLSIYLRCYQYLAFLTRYPKSISVITGTGLTPPVLGS